MILSMLKPACIVSWSLFLAAGSCHREVQPTSAAVCAWSPLITVRDDLLTCSITKTLKASSKASKPRKPPEAEPSVWTGPQHCQGAYCVFSNRGHGAGIALVTTSQNAARANALLQPRNPPALSEPQPAYKVAQIPGRGTGLIATRPIKRGELLLSEAPTMLVHHSVIEELEHGPAQENLLTMATQKLPAPRRRAIMKLVGVDDGGVGERILLNSFRVDLPAQEGETPAVDGQHFGTYPGVARLNHDCRPNLVFHITPELTHLVRAVRDIKEGEELTIAYTDIMVTHDDRAAKIASAWLFECSCRACRASEAADWNAMRIKELEARLQDLGNYMGSKNIQEMIDELLELYVKEGLESKMGGGLTIAAVNLSMLGKAAEARVMAGRAKEHVEWERGGEVADAKGMRDLENDVEGHWSWRKRLDS